MRLSDIVATSRRVSETRARLEKIEHLASCLRHLRATEIAAGVAYLSGEPLQGRIGIGWATLRDASSDSAASEPSLELLEVHQAFERIASVSGAGSTAERTRLLHELLTRATREEQDFLSRLLIGELRQGALEGVMVEAIARAADLHARDVRRAFMLAGDLTSVAQAALGEGPAGLARFSIQLFRPIQPMLAQTAEDVSDALGHLGTAGFEYKLDGARVQVHKGGDDVRVFTRRLNDVTDSVPEIVDVIRALAVREIILDGEALALRGDGTPHPFQTTMRRFGRKLDVAQIRQELPLSSYFFDCLFLDGEPLIDCSTKARSRLLSESIPKELLIPRIVTGDIDEAETFLRAALKAGHEGLMAKALDAPYAAGGRGRSWLKLKPAHTLDLVVLAAEWGHGRRRGWLSNLHLGARDPETDGFVMLGKTFKGMTDEMLAWQTKRLQELEFSRDEWAVYVRPELVVEIAFNEIQESPHYPGGLALRFARLKGYRPDKAASDADTIDTVRAMYEGRVGRG